MASVIARCAVALAAVLAFSAPAAASEPATAPVPAWPANDRVMVLVKFVPAVGRAASGRVRFDPASCGACVVLHDPAYERFNSQETVAQLSVPRNRLLTLAFEIDARDAERAFVNRTSLPVTHDGRRVQIELPPLAEDAIWAPAYATEIEEAGMTLRFEHADPVRRAGAYASGAFPLTERRAADNLTFALREAIRRLGLGTYVEREKIGRIMVMGFDTNFPAGHTDAPAHVHMHLRWPNNVGTQIGHFYLNPQGLLTHNEGGVRALRVGSRRFEPGQKFDTIDRFGRVAFSHTITPAGSLEVAGPDGRACALTPIGTGFHTGVALACGAAGSTTVVVADDIATGNAIIDTGVLRERLRYDVATGELLTPVAPPRLPASALNPD